MRPETVWLLVFF